MFEESDKVNFDQLKENLLSDNHTFPSAVTSFEIKKISVEDKMSLVRTAGYVTRKDIMSEDELFETTSFYASKFGQYTDMLDRGNLKVPSNRANQWTFFSYVMFVIVKDKVCQKSLSDLLLEISTIYDFGMSKSHAKSLANIFLNNLCKALTPRDSKAANLKVLKLSV